MVECNSIGCHSIECSKDFIIIINEERNYRELKESIGITKGQEDKK